ncbi:hypothetical protein [Mycolicibacterium brumae]|uniref:Uncharacterized protein n=1 Tax=Mycolicibacterium brumae TaxID=85968 RepID=A0A2G5P5Z4_9MYCO|nr:hypothetical protein [Mycolicibacterium brumae]MCV7193853.1 hypothetical protein [Mycolicibacterium brumae]PIB73324.1 hypothetical protein CQY22_017385 [Mycolicibacterium brumae]RWA18048.1 hypothetical protein MBRU_18080 [Mycolicibacterium brumae DSM 44177]UWW08860.1 hypothetical protein L2Z93_001932 [Mycolicibacterium brumae]
MSTDPDEIRARVAELLADLPDLDAELLADTDVEELARRLEQAHEMLVAALESVEKG